MKIKEEQEKIENNINNIKNPILRHLSSQQIINNIICEEKNEYKREKINKNHHKEHISIVKNRSSSVFTESQDENKLKDNYYKNINKQKDKPEVQQALPSLKFCSFSYLFL